MLDYANAKNYRKIFIYTNNIKILKKERKMKSKIWGKLKMYVEGSILVVIVYIFGLWLKIALTQIVSRFRKKKSIAFFHPYCASGGGGERVLWVMMSDIFNWKEISNDIDDDNNIEIVIYTASGTGTKKQIFKKVKERFQITISDENAKSIKIVYINTHKWLSGDNYPLLTMICQSIASMVVTIECLIAYTPSIFVDTTGIPFGNIVAKCIGGCSVAAYVHYPIISSDMLSQVREMRPSYNNDSRIAGSQTISKLKYYYYLIFSYCFSLSGYAVDIVMVNSSWTRKHIEDLWNIEDSNIYTVFPPCGASYNSNNNNSNRNKERERYIVSVGQFRPEKDHRLQIDALASLFKRSDKKNNYENVKLIMLGSTRNRDDEELASNLLQYASSKDLSDHVEILINKPYTEIQRWMTRCTIGIHTMWNEHFGISVVEMMAAGLIVVAHNSGGPKLDIMKPIENQIPGYLAATPEEYADQIERAFKMNDQERRAMKNTAQFAVEAFGDEQFCSDFYNAFQPLLQK